MNYKRELLKFKDYLEDHVQPGTLKVYIYALGKWFDYLDGEGPTQAAAQRYVDLIAKAKSPSTTSLRAHTIMRYFRWKGKQVRLDCPTIRLGEVEYLTMDQIDKVLGVCSNALEETLIVVLFDTAVRVSELLNLGLSDIDWSYKLISVVRKGGRKEQVNISDKGLKALEGWLDARVSKSERVFMDLSYYEAWTIIRDVGKKAGMPLHPHIFRHSRAVQMLMNGADLHIVQQHLGHKSITTTANIYGRFKAIHLKELVPAW